METLLEQSNAEEFPRQLEATDLFYRAVHPLFVKDCGKISPSAFSNASGTDGMSVDWAARSSPQETFDRWPQWGDCRGVASITAELCWQNDQEIKCAPEEGNRAHSNVIGEKSGRVRKNLAKCAKLIIPS